MMRLRLSFFAAPTAAFMVALLIGATAQAAPPNPINQRFPQRPPPPSPNALTAPAGQTPAVTPAAANNAAANSVSQTTDYKALAAKGRFHFDFAKAQVADIVKVISEITQKNFIIPEKIKGQQLTIMSPRPVTADEAYRAFLSALEANDITVVRAGAFYKLVQSADGAKYPNETFTDDKNDLPSSDVMVTKLIHLDHSDANAISQIIKTFMSKFAQVAVYQPTNALIVSEYSSNLIRIEQLLTKLDTEGTADQIRLIRIQYASATEIAQKLTDLFDVKKGGGAAGRATPAAGVTPGNPAGGGGSDDQLSISKLIPDDRTNQLIIVANDFAFHQIKELIEKLDVPVGEDTGQVKVVSLQNANAEDLAGVLSSLAQGTTKRKATNANGGTGTPPPPQNGGTGNASASLFEGEVKITADKSTNALVIIASPRDFRSLKRMIDQLDLPRRQVFVEMAIMEVSVSDTNNFGTEWYSGIKPAAGTGAPLGGGLGLINSVTPVGSTSPLVTSALSPLSLLSTFGGAVAGYAGTPINVPVGTSGTNIQIPSFGILLQALESTSNANVISTPYLLATNNEESTIEVGQKVPFASNTGVSSGLSSIAGAAAGASGASGGLGALGGISALGGLGGLGTQIQRIDVSLKINLTPHINDGDHVMLEIDETLEDLSTPKVINGVEIPVTTKRALKSKVVVDDQQTVVLGGLIRDNVTEGLNKYPFLGDIPILGWLFKTKTKTKAKSNLLLVITPYVIRSRDDFQRIYARKQAEYKAFVDLFYSDHKEYRATIDYTHKNGAFALMAIAVKKEMTHPENGGSGDGDVIVIPHGNVSDTRNPYNGPNAMPEQGGRAPTNDQAQPMPPQDQNGVPQTGAQAPAKDSVPPPSIPPDGPIDRHDTLVPPQENPTK